MSEQQSTFGLSAYGGAGWSPRSQGLETEIGGVWGACGIDSEWRTLRSVLLHRPGAELEASASPNQVQMLAPIDVPRAGEDHDALAQAYRDAQVTVHTVEPAAAPRPNQPGPRAAARAPRWRALRGVLPPGQEAARPDAEDEVVLRRQLEPEEAHASKRGFENGGPRGRVCFGCFDLLRTLLVPRC